MAVTVRRHKRGSPLTGLEEEGGLRKKLKVECEVQEDGSCQIRDAEDLADISLDGDIIDGSVGGITTTTISTIETPEDHRAYMDEFAAHLIARKKTMMVPDEKLHAIVSYLRNGTPLNPKLKFWLNLKKMMMVTLPELDLHDELVVPREVRDGGATGLLRVVPVSQLYSLVSGLHNVQHAGYKKVKMVVDREYYGVPRSYVQAFCRTCPSCSKMQPLPIPLPPKEPVVNSRRIPQFGSRESRPRRQPRWGASDRGMLGRSLQVDLLDMQHAPDGEFRHICHVMDHFSQFHFLFPLKSQAPGEVARGLEERVMAYLGPPRVIHSSNGPQFVHKLSKILFGGWGSDTPFLGRAQGSMASGSSKGAATSKTVVNRLARLRADLYDPAAHFPWTTWLPRVMYCLNMHRSPATPGYQAIQVTHVIQDSAAQQESPEGQDSMARHRSPATTTTTTTTTTTHFPYQVLFGREPPGRCPCWCEDRGPDTSDQDLDHNPDQDLDQDPEEEEEDTVSYKDQDQESDKYHGQCPEQDHGLTRIITITKTEDSDDSESTDHC